MILRQEQCNANYWSQHIKDRTLKLLLQRCSTDRLQCSQTNVLFTLRPANTNTGVHVLGVSNSVNEQPASFVTLLDVLL